MLSAPGLTLRTEMDTRMARQIVSLLRRRFPVANDRAGRYESQRGMTFKEATILGIAWLDSAAAFPVDVKFEQPFSRSATLGSQSREATKVPRFTAHFVQTLSFRPRDMNVKRRSTSN